MPPPRITWVSRKGEFDLFIYPSLSLCTSPRICAPIQIRNGLNGFCWLSLGNLAHKTMAITYFMSSLTPPRRDYALFVCASITIRSQVDDKSVTLGTIDHFLQVDRRLQGVSQANRSGREQWRWSPNMRQREICPSTRVKPNLQVAGFRYWDPPEPLNYFNISC